MAQEKVWHGIAEQKPDAWIWLGDVMYADRASTNKRVTEYNKIKRHPGYQKLLSTSQVIGTWDDHDYYNNDAGAHHPSSEEKEGSKKAHLDFFDIPETHEVRTRPGIYRMHTIKKHDVDIDVILLDNRYFMNANNKKDAWERTMGSVGEHSI